MDYHSSIWDFSHYLLDMDFQMKIMATTQRKCNTYYLLIFNNKDIEFFDIGAS